jgi:hypothetical protein
MGALDDLSGYIDQARKTLGQVDQVVKTGEQLHRQLSGGAPSNTTVPFSPDIASGVSKLGGPVVIVVGVAILLAVAYSVRR